MNTDAVKRAAFLLRPVRMAFMITGYTDIPENLCIWHILSGARC